MAIALFILVECASNKPADSPKCKEFYETNETASKDLNMKFEELNEEFEVSKFNENLVCLETIICSQKSYCITWEKR
jgi:hypothetical protein